MSGLALLVSFIAPGAGQILIGKFALGILIGLLFSLGKSALLPLSLRMLGVKQLQQMLRVVYVCNWGYILLIFTAALLSVFQAQGVQHAHVVATIFFIICVRVIKKQTFNAFIFTALCGRSGMWKILQHISKNTTEKK